MTQPYNVLDYPTDDGVRDPFRWGRFASPWMLAGGTLLVVLVLATVTGGGDGAARNAGHETAIHLLDTAHRLTAPANMP